MSDYKESSLGSEHKKDQQNPGEKTHVVAEHNPVTTVETNVVVFTREDNPDKDGADVAETDTVSVPVVGRSGGEGEKEKSVDVAKGSSDGGSGGSGVKKRGRPPKLDGGSSGSGVEKTKKKAAELKDPPSGEPTCHECKRKFGSWKAVFGHLRSHKERDYKGLLPPPRFTPTPPGSPEREAGANAGEGASASGSERGLGVDLNAPPEETGAVAGFDLNMLPSDMDTDED